MMDDDNDDDDTIVEVATAVKPKQVKGISHRIDDFSEGTDECFWCSKVFQKSEMRKERSHNSVIYICRDCL